MSALGPQRGVFKPLFVDGLPGSCLLLHAVCNHVPLRIPLLVTANRDQIRCILRQSCRFVFGRFHRVEVRLGAVGDHVPLVTPLVSAVIQGRRKKVTKNFGYFFKIGKPLLAFIHAVFDHVKLASPFLGAFSLDARSVVNRFSDFCRDREWQNKSCQGNKSQAGNGHRGISFEYHWRVTKCASVFLEIQVPVARTPLLKEAAE